MCPICVPTTPYHCGITTVLSRRGWPLTWLDHIDCSEACTQAFAKPTPMINSAKRCLHSVSGPTGSYSSLEDYSFQIIATVDLFKVAVGKGSTHAGLTLCTPWAPSPLTAFLCLLAGAIYINSNSSVYIAGDAVVLENNRAGSSGGEKRHNTCCTIYVGRTSPTKYPTCAPTLHGNLSRMLTACSLGIIYIQ